MNTTCTRPHTVVTGASSGIGRVTALRLAAAGHHVFAGVRKPADAPHFSPGAGGSAGVGSARPAPGDITPLLLDVTDAGQIGAAARAVADHTAGSGLNGLVNNAGIGVFGPLEIIPIEQFRRQLEVNVTGQLAVTQAFAPSNTMSQGPACTLSVPSVAPVAAESRLTVLLPKFATQMSFELPSTPVGWLPTLIGVPTTGAALGTLAGWLTPVWLAVVAPCFLAVRWL